ncbi:MAG: hypothetical protein QOJ01_615, partial [Solirubrobacterales bacterium]|nr:hypothetical protein [Solirubrobacterales bacterium]
MRKLSSLRPVLACIAVVMLFALTPAASAKWVIKGHGFGHGIGMSQYGAYGYAQHGRNYKQILGHYYKHTKVEKVKPRKIKVLLTSGVGAVSFSGAKKACGRSLSKSKAYSFASSGSRVVLQNGRGHKLSSCGGTGSTAGGRAITISGHKYRGGLVATLVSGSLYVINRVGLEDYVQGVVPNEMPASWAQQALRVQAVAARSYALATRSGSSVFDVYDDTRSQVYGGLQSEQAASNQATRKTAGKVVTYHGKVATTYFFSTSG